MWSLEVVARVCHLSRVVDVWCDDCVSSCSWLYCSSHLGLELLRRKVSMEVLWLLVVIVEVVLLVLG